MIRVAVGRILLVTGFSLISVFSYSFSFYIALGLILSHLSLSLSNLLIKFTFAYHLLLYFLVLGGI